MESEELIIFGGIFAVAAALVGYAIHLGWRGRRRTAALVKVARRLGFEFSARVGALPPGVSGFHLFNQGHSRKGFNLMHYSSGQATLWLLDYRYFVHYGHDQETWCQSVACLWAKGMRLPRFELRPEGFWERFGKWLGAQDIDFGSRPEFSRTYLLQSSQEQATRGLFTDDVLAFFEQTPGLCVEADGEWLICYRAGVCAEPERFEQFLAEALSLFRTFHPTASHICVGSRARPDLQ